MNTPTDHNDARPHYILACCRMIPGGEFSSELAAAACEGQVHVDELEQLRREGALTVVDDRYQTVAGGNPTIGNDPMRDQLRAQLNVRLLARVGRWYCSTLHQCALARGIPDRLHALIDAEFGDEGRYFDDATTAALWLERDQAGIRAAISACDLRDNDHLRWLAGWMAYLTPSTPALDASVTQDRLGCEMREHEPHLAVGLLLRAATAALENGDSNRAQRYVIKAQKPLNQVPYEDYGARKEYSRLVSLLDENK